MFIDDDVELPVHFLRRVHRYLADGADVIVPDFRIGRWVPDTAPIREERRVEREWRERRPVDVAFDEIASAATGIRRASFEHVGGFDSSFTEGEDYGNEDVDLGYRLLREGAAVRRAADVVVFTDEPHELGRLLVRARKVGRNDVRLVRKHPELAIDVFGRKLVDSRIERIVESAILRVPSLGLILVPLAFKLIVAVLLYRLLRDLGLRSPWPGVGAAAWMLEPLGTEAALWPAAFHVGLGPVFALWALRLFRRDRVAAGTVAVLGAFLSLEQAIFALPLAVWWTGSNTSRRRATIATAAAACVVLIAYATWPGHNPKNVMAIGERLHGLVADPSWYVLFPAAGLGFHSGLLGFVWALPYSVAVVLGTAALAAAIAPVVVDTGSDAIRPQVSINGVAIAAALILLVNLPLLLTLPNVGLSARTFTPTWLVLSALAAWVGASVPWKRVRLLGAVAGTFAAFAALSLVLSVSVRLRTAVFDCAAAGWIAERTDDGDVVAICDVPGRSWSRLRSARSISIPCTLGTAAGSKYHTGRVVEVRRSGERYWGSRCPRLDGAGLVVSFPELLRVVNRPRPDRGTA